MVILPKMVNIGMQGLEFGIPINKPYIDDKASGLEVCRLDCHDSSATLRAALSNMNGVVPQGIATSAVWQRWLRPFASLHSSLIVVDRYAGVRHSKKVDEGREGDSGLLRLVSGLHSLRYKKYLTLFSSICDGVSAQDISNSIKASVASLVGGNLAELRLFLFQDAAFMRAAHYRYIRFSDDICLISDTGLEILEGDAVFRQSPYNFGLVRGEVTACESALRGAGVVLSRVFRPVQKAAIAASVGPR